MAKTQFSFGTKFLSDLADLPKDVKVKFVKCLDLLSKDRFNRGLNVEPLSGRAQGLFSARVDLDYRLIFDQRSETDVRLLLVGKHDDVYREAEKIHAERIEGPPEGETPIISAKPSQLSKIVISDGGKYLPLSKYLAEQPPGVGQVELSFADVERIIAQELPRAARKYRAWWANDKRHAQASAWLVVGWKTEKASLEQQRVLFVRAPTAGVEKDGVTHKAAPSSDSSGATPMGLLLDAIVPPLHLDAHGVYRVSGTRVTLESLLAVFQQGATAEDIAQAFPSVPLADIYAIIAFYLRHRKVVEEYLNKAEEREQEARREMKARFPMTEMRERLLARRKPVTL